MKIITKIIAKAALETAKKSFGEASVWTAHQPKEPALLKEIVKK